MNSDPESNRRQTIAVAKRLHFAHSKITTGEAKKWQDASDEDRKIWMRLARTAAKALLTPAQKDEAAAEEKEAAN